MTSDRPRTGPPPPPAPASAEQRPAPPPYEPPAVAWEEPLQTIAATSCGAGNPFSQTCQARPVA